MSMGRVGRVLAACLLLGGQAAAAHLRPGDLARLKVAAPTRTEAYGPGPLQFGALRVPAGRGRFPVVMIVHGGCWTKGFATLRYMEPLAAALARAGVATWNIEYRQAGDAGGGWPGTFLDWGAALDHLRGLARRYPLDLGRVLVAGHSAGGHAALWLAGRPHLPADSVIRGADPLALAGAISIDGPGDLKGFVGPDKEICGKDVVAPFMGGTPAQVPARYAQGDPSALLPLGVMSVLVSSVVLAPDAAEHYRLAAHARGDRVEVLSLADSGHFDMLAPARTGGVLLDALILQAAGFSAR